MKYTIKADEYPWEGAAHSLDIEELECQSKSTLIPSPNYHMLLYLYLYRLKGYWKFLLYCKDTNFQQDILYKNVKPLLTMFIIWMYHMHNWYNGIYPNYEIKGQIGKL